MNEFKVTIEQFEGPLDLMLHLIKEKQLDLFDIKSPRFFHVHVDHVVSKGKDHHVLLLFKIIRSTQWRKRSASARYPQDFCRRHQESGGRTAPFPY